jgi:hypothetical protein
MSMGVRKVGQGGSFFPPPDRPQPAKNSMFLDFLGKIVSFSLFFRQKVGSCPHLEKSLRTPMQMRPNASNEIVHNLRR